jgi:hypothetical protein
MDLDPEPDPALFVSDLQDANIYNFFEVVAFTFFRYIYISLQRKKVIKITKQYTEIKVFLTIFA